MKVAVLSALLAITLADAVLAATVPDRQFACPGDRDQTVTTGGKKYQLKCGKAISSPPLKTTPCGSLTQCAELCAADPACVSSTLFKTDCLLKKDGPLFDNAASSSWVFVENVAPPDPQTPVTPGPTPIPTPDPDPNPNNQVSYACAADEKKRFTAGNGKTYELRCGMGSYTTSLRDVPSITLKQCAAECAKDPQCYNADWTESSKTCHLKATKPSLSPWTSGHSWYPVTCPDPRLTAENKNPSVTADLSCPGSDGKIFEGSDGTWFYLQCCTDADGATVLAYATTSNHKECTEKCVADKKCKSVSFDTTVTGSHNCRLYGQGFFSNAKSDGRHYAFVTNPPTKDRTVSDAKRCSTECPFAHGQLFVSPTGENLQMFCKKRHGTTYLKIERRPSFEACMSACGSMPACHSVDYEPRTKKCFYSNDDNQPEISADAFISAHSLGCSGACAACKKGCDQVSGEPMPADAAICDQDHGKIVTAGGEDFRLFCKHCHRTVQSSWDAPQAKNLAECAKACAEDPNCKGSNWMGPGGCVMHPAVSHNGEAVSFWRDARCDALLPLGRSPAGLDTNVKYDNPEVTKRDW